MFYFCRKMYSWLRLNSFGSSIININDLKLFVLQKKIQLQYFHNKVHVKIISVVFFLCHIVHIFVFLPAADRLIGLPEGRARNHNRPQQVPALSGIHIQDVAVGAEHTLVLSSTGDVYTWGSNSEGQVTC